MVKAHSCKIAVLRFLAVILVVFWHANNLTLHYGGAVYVAGQWGVKAVETFISVGLVRISTPLLFAISGFLFFRNFDGGGFAGWFGAKLKTRVQTLLVPYLFWSAWGLLAVFLMQQVPAARPFFYTNLVADYTPSEWFDKLFLNPFPYQLWFIRDLMVYVLLTPLIYPCLKWGGLLLPGVFVGLWLWDVELRFVVTEGLCFYLIGAWLARNGGAVDALLALTRSRGRRDACPTLRFMGSCLVLADLPTAHEPGDGSEQVATGILAGRRGRHPCSPDKIVDNFVSRKNSKALRFACSFFRRAGKPGSTAGRDACRHAFRFMERMKLPALLVGLWVLICAAVAVQVLPDGRITDWLQKLGVVCGCAGVWWSYDACLKKHELRLDAWAQYAIFLFAAHEPLLTVLKKTTMKCLGASELSLLAAYFIAPSVTIGIVLLVAVVMRRHLPRFYSLVSGHR